MRECIRTHIVSSLKFLNTLIHSFYSGKLLRQILISFKCAKTCQKRTLFQNWKLVTGLPHRNSSPATERAGRKTSCLEKERNCASEPSWEPASQQASLSVGETFGQAGQLRASEGHVRKTFCEGIKMRAMWAIRFTWHLSLSYSLHSASKLLTSSVCSFERYLIWLGFFRKAKEEEKEEQEAETFFAFLFARAGQHGPAWASMGQHGPALASIDGCVEEEDRHQWDSSDRISRFQI